ncbi:MAG: uracil-DNA glycosylase family 4 [Planctomycetota bacterium]|jgi:uracil-DNA glycosylase family 4
MNDNKSYDIDCVRCPRLAKHLDIVRRDYPDYHGLPVAPFGVKKPKLLIVGLAPGMHGANATGRPFTGDHAGILLYKALYKYGFSNKEIAIDPKDGLKLKHCRITNAVKCLPPENKPIGSEVSNCNVYLRNEIASLGNHFVILALGGVAHKAVLKALGLKNKDHDFSHAAQHNLGLDKWLIDSYHCSRYNTQTRRLTEAMFFEVFDKIRKIIYVTN